VRDQSLDAQAAVNIGSEKLVDPPGIVGARFCAVFAGPESDDCYQPSLLLGDHDNASSESPDFFHRAADSGRDRGLHFQRAAGSGDKFDAECRDFRGRDGGTAGR